MLTNRLEKPHRNERGLSAVVAMVAAGALIGALALWDLSKGRRAGMKANAVNLTLQTVSQNIVSTLENDQAWVNTINANGLTCLQNEGAVCAGGDFKDISVVLADGTVFVDAAAGAGFNVAGVPCATFNPTGGTRTDCVYRFVVHWQCADSPCQPTHRDGTHPAPIQPRVQFSATLQYSPFAPDDPGKRDRMSAQYYNFSVVRTNLKDSLQNACLNFGGYFDQDTQRCQISSAGSATCPNGYYMTKMNADGSPNCQTPPALLNSYCPQYNGMAGIGPEGGMRCYVF